MNLESAGERPKVGVGVIIIKNDKVLLGQRINSHGHDTWSFPGGHLEFNETPEECAKREVFEETGLQIRDLSRAPYTNDLFVEEKKHYITLYIVAEYSSGEVKIMEPDKTESWEWFYWNRLPQPLFLPIQNLLITGFNPFGN